MNLIGIIGAVSGCMALLGLIYTLAKYSVKIDDLWSMRIDLKASIIKTDTLWQIYIEDNLIRHSNPGRVTMLSDELKGEIKVLLDNDKSLSEVREPTLLVISRIGLGKFSQIAQSNKASLGQVLAQANDYVFECLRK